MWRTDFNRPKIDKNENKVEYMMANKNKTYRYILVESYKPASSSGTRSPFKLRPLPNQDPFMPDMNVEYSRITKSPISYPEGTVFRIKAAVTDHLDTPFIYSHYTWDYKVVSEEELKKLGY